MLFYKVLMNGKEVWEGYRIFNLESAKATAKIWREQHYDYKTRTYPKMQVVKMPENKIVAAI
ncbi:MAG: hypothetical protein PWQ82_1170 [Thermosediminibacterales bacterium]|nr:hypothetical protein [Thermosediminibacterales bacterium]